MPKPAGPGATREGPTFRSEILGILAAKRRPVSTGELLATWATYARVSPGRRRSLYHRLRLMLHRSREAGLVSESYVLEHLSKRQWELTEAGREAWREALVGWHRFERFLAGIQREEVVGGAEAETR